MATVQVVYSLCAMPEYLEPLRLEAQRALQDSGGVWSIDTFSRLQRLDSFMKESQRLNASSFRRFYVCLVNTAKHQIVGANMVCQSVSIAK